MKHQQKHHWKTLQMDPRGLGGSRVSLCSSRRQYVCYCAAFSTCMRHKCMDSLPTERWQNSSGLLRKYSGLYFLSHLLPLATSKNMHHTNFFWFCNFLHQQGRQFTGSLDWLSAEPNGLLTENPKISETRQQQQQQHMFSSVIPFGQTEPS